MASSERMSLSKLMLVLILASSCDFLQNKQSENIREVNRQSEEVNKKLERINEVKKKSQVNLEKLNRDYRFFDSLDKLKGKEYARKH